MKVIIIIMIKNSKVIQGLFGIKKNVNQLVDFVRAYKILFGQNNEHMRIVYICCNDLSFKKENKAQNHARSMQ